MMKRRTLLLATGASAWPLARAVTPGEVPIGQPLREASLRGLNGPQRQLSSSLERLAWGPLAAHLTVIGISTDDYIDKALAFLRQSNATINHYLDRALEMENMLGATHLPLTVLVDAQGRVRDKIAGAQPWDSAEAQRLIESRLGITTKAGRPARS
jgi:hypothetical protein